MLLTYSEHGDIPNKITDFYNQAYEALFQKHDANKGVFKRTRKTSLNMQQFRKVFSSFSLFSYNDAKIQFSRSYSLEMIEKAKLFCQLDFEPERFLDDCLQAVCLLVEDGQVLAYTHRSLQEYFAAVFVDKHLSPSKAYEIARKFSVRANRDTFFDLLFELNPRLVETKVIAPFLEQVANKIEFSGEFDSSIFHKFLQYFYSQVAANSEDQVVNYSIKDPEEWGLLTFVYRRYLAQHLISKSNRNKNKEIARRLSFSDIALGDPIIQNLWDDGEIFMLSPSMVEQFLDLKNQLDASWASSDKSLEDILFG